MILQMKSHQRTIELKRIPTVNCHNFGQFGMFLQVVNVFLQHGQPNVCHNWPLSVKLPENIAVHGTCLQNYTRVNKV